MPSHTFDVVGLGHGARQVWCLLKVPLDRACAQVLLHALVVHAVVLSQLGLTGRKN
jgi:hypothetical protein